MNQLLHGFQQKNKSTLHLRLKNDQKSFKKISIESHFFKNSEMKSGEFNQKVEKFVQ